MKPYTPKTLPLKNLNYELLFPYLGEASSELARYDGLLQGIPNATILLSPLTTKEAVLSSKIEGTQATVNEVLEQEAGMLKEGRYESKDTRNDSLKIYCKTVRFHV
jgi:Fic family protein